MTRSAEPGWGPECWLCQSSRTDEGQDETPGGRCGLVVAAAVPVGVKRAELRHVLIAMFGKLTRMLIEWFELQAGNRLSAWRSWARRGPGLAKLGT